MPKTTSKRFNPLELIQPQVRALTAYHVDETPVRIKLDAMENPFRLPTAVQRELAAAVKNAAINLYPDPSAKELKKAISAYWNIPADRMVLGNGSDELIQAIILAFGGPVLAPTPSFAMYEITSKALGQQFVSVPLTRDFDLDADAVLEKACQTKARIIFLACPNNPTGNRFSDAAVRKVLEQANAAVVIDEAYYSFSGKSFLARLKKHPNMIVMRTLSKIGFAGLRIGLLTAAKPVVDELNKVRLPYNINMLSQVVATTALKHSDELDAQIALLCAEREHMQEELSALPGVTPFPSETNFILFRTDANATKIHAKLKKAGILVKNLDRPGSLANCLRVTIGTPKENDEFLEALKAVSKPSKR